ncbi:MAG: hypothetical protein IKD18_03100 [Clostridia bacterium]|nr:hypothetical protein [Clostridia bacterium]
MKRSIRDFLLTLILALVIFSVVAFFLIRAAESLMGDVMDKIETQKENLPETQEVAQTLEAPVTAAPAAVASLLL